MRKAKSFVILCDQCVGQDKCEEWSRHQSSEADVMQNVALPSSNQQNQLMLCGHGYVARGRWLLLELVTVSLWLMVLITVSANDSVVGDAQQALAMTKSREPVGMESSGSTCSREWSRVAYAILTKYLLPAVEKEKGFTFSSRCDINPARDVYRIQEGNKSMIGRMEWRCLYCGKRFYGETYIDKHMDHRHESERQPDTVCLSDKCEILHCKEWEADNKGEGTAKLLSAGNCRPQIMEQRYRLCQSVARDCFPIDGGAVPARLNEFFTKQFCEGHTCDRKRKLMPEGGRVEHSSAWFYFKLIVVFGLLSIFYGCFFVCSKSVGDQAVVRRIVKRKQA